MLLRDLTLTALIAADGDAAAAAVRMKRPSVSILSLYGLPSEFHEAVIGRVRQLLSPG